MRYYFSSLSTHVASLLAAGRTVILVGGRSTGKSHVIRSVAEGVPGTRRVDTLPILLEPAEIAAVDLPPETEDSELCSVVANSLAKGKGMLLACMPRHLAVLRAHEFSTRCAILSTPFVEKDALSGAEALIEYAGGHPMLVSALIDGIPDTEGGQPDLGAAVLRARLQLEECYRHLYSALTPAEKRHLAALSVGGANTLSELRARGHDPEVFSDLLLTLLVRREENAYAIASAGFRDWIQNLLTLPGLSRGRIAQARPEASHQYDKLDQQAVSILHISDLQFGPKQAHADRHKLFAKLRDDLVRFADSGVRRPDIVVCSGDIAEQGLPEEYDEATGFLENLSEHLGLPDWRRVVVAPGNHDVCWPLSRAHETHPTLRTFRMAPYRMFRSRWSPELRESTDVRHFPEFAFACAAFDTTERIDHLNAQPWLDEACVTQAIDRLRRDAAEEATLMAVMHHGPVEHEDDQDTLENSVAIRKVLEVSGFRLCYHGHVHEPGLTQVNGLWLLAAGSLSVRANALPGDDRVGRVRNHYQLMVLGVPDVAGRNGCLYAREYSPHAPGGGRWVGAWIDDGKGDVTSCRFFEIQN